MSAPGPALTPEANVAGTEGGLVAVTTEPWLAIAPHPALRPGGLVEITYRVSFWDTPVRPVFRFWISSDEWRDQIAPGAVAGTAIFQVRIPSGTTRMSVSPTHREGRFDFEITAVRRVSFIVALAKAIGQKPREARSAILTRLIGWAEESDVNLAWASGSTPIAGYAKWRKARGRDIELRAIDAPRFDWTMGPEIHLLADAESAARTDLVAMIGALRAQAYPRWRLDLVADRETGDLPKDPRIGRLARSDVAARLAAGAPDRFVAAIAAGDVLHPHALAMIAEAAARQPEARVLYGDEDFRTAADMLVPVFKPGWSPLLEAGRPYLGHAVFLRGDVLAGWTDTERSELVARAAVPATASARFEAGKVASLRRVLLTRARPWPRSERTAAEPVPAMIHLPGNPSASIVIPTRDRADLLGRCIESLFATTAFANFSIVIIDNGSVEPATKQLFEAFRGDKNVTILRSPGPFNYSALCNAAAARRKADVLVFLNNDTEVIAEDWLGRLVAQALLPEVGAVGGLLLYPNRRIQHAGVVLGMGNAAGHFGAGAPEAAPGWLSLNEVAHEVGAVTGACLAVARRKFMLVGGFDAEHLPVENSDIDLCLRLAENGWPTRFDPEVRLVHAESASRGGATFRRLHVYAEQRRRLHARWLGILRDDPYFHPGLSLYSRDEALS